MLIALFALAHLPIFRKTPPPSLDYPRCGRALKATADISIRAPSIREARRMSSGGDQNEPIAANGNAAESTDVEIMYVPFFGSILNLNVYVK